MEFSSVVTVLSARRYSFADEEKKGRQIEGCKIEYVDDWSGHEKQNSKGLDVFSATIDYADFEQLTALPADYDATFSVSKNSKGQPVLHVEELSFVQYFTPLSSALVSPNAEPPGGKQGDKPSK